MRMMALGGMGPTARSRQHRRQGRGWALNAAILLGVIGVLAAIVANVGNARREVRALPPEQRVAVYARTVADLRDFCGEGRPEALRDHCRSLADFVVQFDECRVDCEALARPLLVARPTR